MPSLTIQNVTKVYPTGRKALDGVDLEIGEGVFGLLGPNGAGKSTLMEILVGSLGFEAGRVTFDGSDVGRHPVAWRRRLGYMPQTLDFVPNQTGEEYLQECCLLSGFTPRSARHRIAEFLERVNLTHAAKRAATGYSRGMKQRLAIAAALVTDPPLVLLDEPTSGLDPRERVFFRELLASVSSGRTVILSTHIVNDVERCCGQIGVLADGRILFTGAPQELIRGVEGRVWETTLPADQIDEWVESGRVVTMREEAGEVRARLVSADQPLPGARQVDAGLEDAYMHAVGPEGLRAPAMEIAG
ncbi:ATP-binding cassette domain-containing protein [bacterium]|nr:ATP-binding cassette domain-containing protein [bacterium]